VKVAIGFQSERFRSKVENLVNGEVGWKPEETFMMPCDVDNDEDVLDFASQCSKHFGPNGVNMLAHSIAYAPKECLKGRFVDVSREGFKVTMDTSVFSLISLTRAFLPYFETDTSASVMALSFDGSNRVVPGYGLMGPAKACLETSCRYLAADLGPQNIRVNCISAGPINSLAARGIPDFRNLQGKAFEQSPLPEKTEAAHVGDVATFLASECARTITGQTLFVDSGYSITR